MPEMTLSRNFRLATTAGHILQFKRGVPLHVPKTIVKDALAIGAVFVDDKNREEILPEEESAPKAAPQGDEREAAVFVAFQTLIESNGREEFSAAGVPKIDSINALTGFKIDKKECSRLWAEFQEAQALEKAAA